MEQLTQPTLDPIDEEMKKIEERIKEREEQDILYWIWLTLRCGFGSEGLGYLVRRHTDPFEIYRMEADELAGLACDLVKPALLERLANKDLSEAREIYDVCEEAGIEIVPYSHPRYPGRLRLITDPPGVLYVKGRLPDLNQRLCVAVVGTRKLSENGANVTYDLSYELAAADCVVVSGMALGVDGVAASGALAAGGSTIAVLGGGLLRVYPKEHEALAVEIARFGALVSEYPPMTEPRRYYFPARNRIVSGMSQGTLVVEAALKSGSLITAETTLRQGRQLFAVVGENGRGLSEGTDELLSRGALPVTCVRDVLREFHFLYGDTVDPLLRDRILKRKPAREVAQRRFGGVAPRAPRDKSESKRPTPDQFRLIINVTEKTHEFWENRPLAKVPIHRARSKEALLRDQFLEQEKLREKKRKEEAKEAAENTAKAPVVEDEAKKKRILRLLADLDDFTRRVYLKMPDGERVVPELIKIDAPDLQAIATAMTMLEMVGLVRSFPGSVYVKL